MFIHRLFHVYDNITPSCNNALSPLRDKTISNLKVKTLWKMDFFPYFHFFQKQIKISFKISPEIQFHIDTNARQSTFSSFKWVILHVQFQVNDILLFKLKICYYKMCLFSPNGIVMNAFYFLSHLHWKLQKMELQVQQHFWESFYDSKT